jgi:hypothetical protein
VCGTGKAFDEGETGRLDTECNAVGARTAIQCQQTLAAPGCREITNKNRLSCRLCPNSPKAVIAAAL